MNVEQDYIMRMIKEFANVLGRLLFNKKKPMYELDVTNRYHVGDDLYTRLCRMADEGKINEAENLLYEEMVPGDMDYLEMALAFYAYLNCFAVYGIQRSPFCFRTAVFRNQRPSLF